MKLYIVAGRYQRTQDDAKARAKAVGVTFNPEIDIVDVPTKQADLVDFLNTLTEEMFTAGKQAGSSQQATLTEVAPKDASPSYAEQSVAIDDAFGRAPVPQQLALATLAMQSALDEIARLNKLSNPAKPEAAKAPEPADAEDYV